MIPFALERLADMEKLIKKLGSISSDKIFDVACGRGEFIDILMQVLKDYEKFIGIDFSDKIVKFAQEHFKDKPVEIIKIWVLQMIHLML